MQNKRFYRIHKRCLFVEISRLKNLTVLEAINNKLSYLPIEISECTSLMRLVVDRNELYWLPRQLCQLHQLTELSATGNKLLCIPLGIDILYNNGLRQRITMFCITMTAHNHNLWKCECDFGCGNKLWNNMILVPVVFVQKRGNYIRMLVPFTLLTRYWRHEIVKECVCG